METYSIIQSYSRTKCFAEVLKTYVKTDIVVLWSSPILLAIFTLFQTFYFEL